MKKINECYNLFRSNVCSLKNSTWTFSLHPLQQLNKESHNTWVNTEKNQLHTYFKIQITLFQQFAVLGVIPQSHRQTNSTPTTDRPILAHWRHCNVAYGPVWVWYRSLRCYWGIRVSHRFVLNFHHLNQMRLIPLRMVAWSVFNDFLHSSSISSSRRRHHRRGLHHENQLCLMVLIIRKVQSTTRDEKDFRNDSRVEILYWRSSWSS